MSDSYYRQARNVEKSVHYYLETNINTDWTGINTVQTWNKVYDKDVALPIICIRLSNINSSRLEIGTDTLDDRYLIIVDIFATSNGQLIDLADYIKTKLIAGWVHYDWSHESGSNKTLTKTINGRDIVTEFITNTKIEIPETIDVKDKYRWSVSVSVRNS